MRSAYIPAVALSAITGCFVGSLFSVPITLTSFALLVISGAFIFAKPYRYLIFTVACVAALLLGLLRMAEPWTEQSNLFTTHYTGTVTITGSVVSDIEHRKSYSRYTVAVTTVNDAAITNDVSILVYEPYPSRCVTGEIVTFSGTLIEPENFVTDTGRVFPYRQYLRQFNIHALSFINTSSCRGSADHIAVFAHLRQTFMQAMQRILPTQEASLLGGLILGLRGSLSEELLDVFRITGLIHIIVLSGHNVTLVAEATRRIASRSGKRTSLIIALVTIILFVLLSGAQTAAIRAGTMAVIALLARSMHREYDGIRALLLVAMVMTLIDPNQALFNISFHLSFLATLGLLLFAPVIEPYLTKIPNTLELRGVVVATIAVQCTLLPYLAYAIGEVSLVGIIANIIILPLVPLSMAAGAITTIVALILPALGLLIMPAAYLPLTAMIQTASFLAAVPHATMTLPAFPALWAAITTTGIVVLGVFLQKKYVYAKERPEGIPSGL